MNYHSNINLRAGLDLGDKDSHLCLLDTQSGEIIERSRLRSTIETFENRFASMQRCRSPLKRVPNRCGSAGS